MRSLMVSMYHDYARKLFASDTYRLPLYVHINIEVPFMVYVYETQAVYSEEHNGHSVYRSGIGKVIGKGLCNKVTFVGHMCYLEICSLELFEEPLSITHFKGTRKDGVIRILQKAPGTFCYVEEV